jgi:hypothetical protein
MAEIQRQFVIKWNRVEANIFGKKLKQTRKLERSLISGPRKVFSVKVADDFF